MILGLGPDYPGLDFVLFYITQNRAFTYFIGFFCCE